mmetsp:Transcript_6621/g.14292  ORF Transcript_6621/g.14292 Transcript_6621/m.14292 type:complete len:175 (-) Transcript_6621:114-638(-)|eukprot:CAMPEP_0113308902 /NCGR_PEP_ID=MMETSP0010_2-20120614/7167_1 /TAXON_ID=216773 ORGANISM="Corethron hystrix, Strain 308" /NCGR_SAMPLE_ID=MMETSP0010_2 /ASSEMBLY_ACC=CAM_ASM_000155 /LENGTH=174 /DNA_ID=CAMNT_0000164061 /DNA_START=478 /DNA_END=1002 /DNA_ORIENTATION=+ /assembly_acc=CAM_ASM_000155
MMYKADFRLPPRQPPRYPRGESPTSQFVRHARACSESKAMIDRISAFLQTKFHLEISDISYQELDVMIEITTRLITQPMSKALKRRALKCSGTFGGRLFKFAKKTRDKERFDQAQLILQMVIYVDLQVKKRGGGTSLCQRLLKFYTEQKIGLHATQYATVELPLTIASTEMYDD